MTNTKPPGRANASAAGADRPIRCLTCGEPITGDGITVPAVNPFEQGREVVCFRAAYHSEHIPSIVRTQLALAGVLL